MRRTVISGMLNSREIACADADRLIDDRKPRLVGRKRWSPGEDGAIIDKKEELINVKWGPENH